MKPFVYSTEQDGSKCIEVQLNTAKNSSTWKLGQCHATHTYADAWTYTEKCCLPNGDHLLSCENTETDGWVSSNVKIGEHLFCDDIVGYNKLIRINPAGT